METTPAQKRKHQLEPMIRQRFVDDREQIEPIGSESRTPLRLHHYTTLDGLMGIVGSSSIWASDARFVNDSSELTYASELISTEVVTAINQAIGIRDLISVYPEMADPFQIGLRPFIACFCEEGDLLSQWRGYRANETGYSLGFDLSRVFRLSSNTVLRKVIYDPEEQRAAVRSAVRSWIGTAEALLGEEGLQPEDLFPYPAMWELRNSLAEHHLCFKNPSFAEEREWRLVKLIDVREELQLLDDQRLEKGTEEHNRRLLEIDPSFEPLKLPPRKTHAEGVEICFRRSPLGLVPYTELPLLDTAGVFTNRLPLWGVIQGPHMSPELSLESLQLYLRSSGYGIHTDVKASEIPLRM